MLEKRRGEAECLNRGEARTNPFEEGEDDTSLVSEEESPPTGGEKDAQARATQTQGEASQGEDTRARTRATQTRGEASQGEDSRARTTPTENEAPGPMTRARLRRLQESIRQLKETRPNTSGEAEPPQTINISLIQCPEEPKA